MANLLNQSIWKRILLGVLLGWLSLSFLPAHALPAGDAITDGRTLLRLALPIDEPTLQALDRELSRIGPDLKYNRWSPTSNDIHKAQQILNRSGSELLAQLDPSRKPQAESAIGQMQQDLSDLEVQVGRKSKGKSIAEGIYGRLLATLELLEQNWVKSFPFIIPAEYAKLPQLLCRAEVELETTVGTMRLVLDGYNAPITAGNFADLVKKGFYDGLEFTRVENFFLAQAGDPPGSVDGYIDPGSQKVRTIPLEIRLRGEPKPRYGQILEDVGITGESQPILPFSAKGTLAMARGEDPNSGSSQFFLFIAEPDLTPAGLNLLDGRYAVFGYVTSGLEVMDKLRVGTQIRQARLTLGSENLKA